MLNFNPTLNLADVAVKRTVRSEIKHQIIFESCSYPADFIKRNFFGNTAWGYEAKAYRSTFGFEPIHVAGNKNLKNIRFGFTAVGYFGFLKADSFVSQNNNFCHKFPLCNLIHELCYKLTKKDGARRSWIKYQLTKDIKRYSAHIITLIV